MDDSIKLGIISGFIASILATIFIWVFYSFFEKVILVNYQTLIYKGPILNGTWHNSALIRDGRKTEATMVLRQKGTKILGEMVMQNINKEAKYTLIYSMNGHIIGNLVHLFGNPTDRKNVGFTTGLFQITEGGNKLTGGAVGQDNFESHVFNLENIEWIRS